MSLTANCGGLTDVGCIEIDILDDGTPQGSVEAINFVGAGVSSSVVNGVATVTISGNGDVVGPSSSVDNAIVRFDGTTGKIIQDYTSGAPTISDSGAINVPAATGNSFTVDTTTFVVDASNNVVMVGTASPVAVNIASTVSGNVALQNISTGANAGSLNMRFSNAANAASVIMGKSRGSTVGTNTMVNTGDPLGNLSWVAADGTNYMEAARIRATAATVASGSVSGNIEFMTTLPGASSSGVRMTLIDSGYLGIGTGAPSTALELAGNSTTDQVIRLNNTDTTLAVGQQLGGLEFYANDANANGVGVMAKISGYSNGTTTLFGNLGFYTGADATVLTEKLTILSSGNIGFGQTTPTAVLHLKAGTATANTAPVKLTSGTILTVAEAGVHEYNGNHYLSNATLRFPVGGQLFQSFADVTVGGAETDIISNTTAANTFNVNGDKVLASYGGNFVTVGTESTQLKVYFAGTAIWDSASVLVATGTTSWRVYAELIRVSATVIRYTIILNTTGATGFVHCKSGELTGITLSNTNILKITGTSTGVGSGAGDIIGKMSYVEFKPAA